jgi:hypothetical protein
MAMLTIGIQSCSTHNYDEILLFEKTKSYLCVARHISNLCISFVVNEDLTDNQEVSYQGRMLAKESYSSCSLLL